MQYASLGYREALAKHNINQSMSGKGDPYDNAVAENFSAVLNVNLFITSTIEQELKRKLIYFHISKRITMPCALNRLLIGCLQ